MSAVIVTLEKQKFYEYAIRYIKMSAERCVNMKKLFNIVLAGGETPKSLYTKLVDIDAQWNDWQIWFSDERCLNHSRENMNSTMAEETFLKHVPIKNSHIHRIRGSLGAAEAAKQYQEEIKNTPTFDFTLLGIGEDGHTASLFPDYDLGIESYSPDVLAIYNAPKNPPERVTLSVQRLNRSYEVLFLATGKNKKSIVDKYREGYSMPATAIHGRVKTTLLYCPDD